MQKKRHELRNMMQPIKDGLTCVEASWRNRASAVFGGDALPVKSEGGNSKAKAAIMQGQLLWASVIRQRMSNGPVIIISDLMAQELVEQKVRQASSRERHLL